MARASSNSAARWCFFLFFGFFFGGWRRGGGGGALEPSASAFVSTSFVAIARVSSPPSKFTLLPPIHKRASAARSALRRRESREKKPHEPLGKSSAIVPNSDQSFRCSLELVQGNCTWKGTQSGVRERSTGGPLSAAKNARRCVQRLRPVGERERKMERVRSFVEIPQLLISLPLARLDSTRPPRKMKRIVNLLACFAALAAAYAAALSRPGLLQGRERLMVALVRESEWKNWGREEKGERRKQTRFKKKRSNWVSSTSSERSLGDHPHPAFSPVHARLPDRQQHPPAKKKNNRTAPRDHSPLLRALRPRDAPPRRRCVPGRARGQRGSAERHRRGAQGPGEARRGGRRGERLRENRV